MRIDIYLFEQNLACSRTDAKNLIVCGKVSVNGKIITKPSYDIFGDEEVSVDTSEKKVVRRGGLKLEGALDAFKIDVKDRLAIDVGASSGGFTDCLLQRGASHVIAVDSGYGQLVPILRDDSRVTVIENYNARYMKSEDFEYLPNLAVMDVSFISVTLIIPSLINCLSDSADFVCLIKPQFEVGRSGLGKGGIVKNESLRREAVDKVLSLCRSIGLKCLGVIESPIKGGDGNVEYLAHFKKECF